LLPFTMNNSSFSFIDPFKPETTLEVLDPYMRSIDEDCNLMELPKIRTNFISSEQPLTTTTTNSSLGWIELRKLMGTFGKKRGSMILCNCVGETSLLLISLYSWIPFSYGIENDMLSSTSLWTCRAYFIQNICYYRSSTNMSKVCLRFDKWWKKAKISPR